MGFMTKLLGNKLAVDPTPGGQLATNGNHALSADNFLRQTDEQAITPMNGDRFVAQNYRTIPVSTTARGFTRDEADAVTQQVALNLHKAQHAVRAYSALSKNEHGDAAVQQAHRQYLGHVAQAELKKVGANAQLGKKLQSLRPGYAALGLGYQESEKSANNRVAILKARIAGVMS